jgi:hypothetical protein
MDFSVTLNASLCPGMLFSGQGKLDDAEKMLMRALVWVRASAGTSGPDHTSTLNAVKILGALYSDQGELAKAEQMFMRARMKQ